MPHREAKKGGSANGDLNKQEHLSVEMRIQISKKELENMKKSDPLFAEEGEEVKVVKEEDEEEEEEWEDVEDNEEARHLRIVELGVLEEKSKQKKDEMKDEDESEKNWAKNRRKESIRRRRRKRDEIEKDVYSMTHGFVRGKSLEEWKSDEEEEEIFEEEESTKALRGINDDEN